MKKVGRTMVYGTPLPRIRASTARLMRWSGKSTSSLPVNEV